MTTPLPEVAARLFYYEARLKAGALMRALYGAYPDAEEWIDVVRAHCADLRALLADHASLTADVIDYRNACDKAVAERDRMAGALERDALAAALVDMPPDRFAHWAANGTTYPNSYQSEIDRTYKLADRIRAALTQPEHREESDVG